MSARNGFFSHAVRGAGLLAIGMLVGCSPEVSERKESGRISAGDVADDAQSSTQFVDLGFITREQPASFAFPLTRFGIREIDYFEITSSCECVDATIAYAVSPIGTALEPALQIRVEPEKGMGLQPQALNVELTMYAENVGQRIIYVRFIITDILLQDTESYIE